jgi:hypothetical protein
VLREALGEVTRDANVERIPRLRVPEDIHAPGRPCRTRLGSKQPLQPVPQFLRVLSPIDIEQHCSPHTAIVTDWAARAQAL